MISFCFVLLRQEKSISVQFGKRTKTNPGSGNGLVFCIQLKRENFLTMPEKEVSAVFAMRSSPLMAAVIETNNEKSNITVLTAAVQGAQFECAIRRREDQPFIEPVQQAAGDLCLTACGKRNLCPNRRAFCILAATCPRLQRFILKICTLGKYPYSRAYGKRRRILRSCQKIFILTANFTKNC